MNRAPCSPMTTAGARRFPLAGGVRKHRSAEPACSVDSKPRIDDCGGVGPCWRQDVAVPCRRSCCGSPRPDPRDFVRRHAKVTSNRENPRRTREFNLSCEPASRMFGYRWNSWRNASETSLDDMEAPMQ